MKRAIDRFLNQDGAVILCDIGLGVVAVSLILELVFVVYLLLHGQ